MMASLWKFRKCEICKICAVEVSEKKRRDFGFLYCKVQKVRIILGIHYHEKYVFLKIWFDSTAFSIFDICDLNELLFLCRELKNCPFCIHIPMMLTSPLVVLSKLTLLAHLLDQLSFASFWNNSTEHEFQIDTSTTDLTSQAHLRQVCIQFFFFFWLVNVYEMIWEQKYEIQYLTINLGI